MAVGGEQGGYRCRIAALQACVQAREPLLDMASRESGSSGRYGQLVGETHRLWRFNTWVASDGGPRQAGAGYPVLPAMRRRRSDPGAEQHNREILYIRHYSVYTPRDFDISPYFQVVKPTVEHGFNYRSAVRTHPHDVPVRARQTVQGDLEPVVPFGGEQTEYLI